MWCACRERGRRSCGGGRGELGIIPDYCERSTCESLGRIALRGQHGCINFFREGQWVSNTDLRQNSSCACKTCANEMRRERKDKARELYRRGNALRTTIPNASARAIPGGCEAQCINALPQRIHCFKQLSTCVNCAAGLPVGSNSACAERGTCTGESISLTVVTIEGRPCAPAPTARDVQLRWPGADKIAEIGYKLRGRT